MTKLTDLVDELEAENAKLRQDKAELVGVLSITKSNLKAILATRNDNDESISLRNVIGDIKAAEATIAKAGKEA